MHDIIWAVAFGPLCSRLFPGDLGLGFRGLGVCITAYTLNPGPWTGHLEGLDEFGGTISLA